MSYHIDRPVFTGTDTPLTAINDIPAMNRRRLSPLARLALHSARQCKQDTPIDYIVWSSSYGDESVTATIIKDIAQGHTPSPTLFSVSVHNAIAGLYSIFYQDDTPATSLSSHLTQTLTDAVSEAVSYLQSHQKSVALVVYYDAPLPDIYARTPQDIEQMHALAFLVRGDGVGQYRLHPNDQHAPKDTPQALQWGEFFEQNHPSLTDNRWTLHSC